VPSPIYLTDEIRRIEQAAGEVDPPLMERAGTAAAELAARLSSDRQKDILVLAGPGNNGGDARIAATLLRDQYFRVTLADAPEIPADKPWALVIDGLFGIGLARDIDGTYARIVDYVNRQSCPVLALDIPSGLHSDTGRVMGRAVRATHTITFIGLKPGLSTLISACRRRTRRPGWHRASFSATCSSPGRATSTREWPGRSASSAARAA